MRSDCEVTRALTGQALDELEKSFAWIRFIPVRPRPLSFHKPDPQVPFNCSISIAQASAPPARQRASKIGINPARFINQSKCSVHCFRRHRIEMDGGVCAAGLVENLSEKVYIETQMLELLRKGRSEGVDPEEDSIRLSSIAS